MAIADAVAVVSHLLFAGLWTGSVVFVALAVLPLGSRGDIDAGPLESLAGTLTTVSRVSAVVLFVSGGHMAASEYTVESLTGSTPGYLVLAMLGLWAVLAGLVEVAAARLTDGASQKKVREPAKAARRPLQGAALVSLLLLLVAGLLAGGLAALPLP